MGRLTRRGKWTIGLGVAFVGVMLIGIIGLALLFEMRVTRSAWINYSKRIAAETAAFFVRFYDPFAAQYKHAVLGPENGATQRGGIWLWDQEEIGGFFKTNPASAKEIGSLSVANTRITRGRFPFHYQPANNERLLRLRKQHRLDEVVGPGQDEFAKMVLLRDWLHQRWQYGAAKNVDFNFNALDILERAQTGEVFFCSEYATTIVQAAASLGWTGRYIGIEGHVTAEIWSNQWKKWVVMDPSFNVHLEFSGIPQNALELRSLWLAGKGPEVRAVLGPSGVTNGTSNVNPHNLIKKFDQIYVRMRNDWFSNRLPHWHPLSNSIMNGVEWVDGKSPDSILISRETSDPRDLYWELNTVDIGVQIDKENSGRILVGFDTITPNFSHFLLKIDGKEQQWKASTFTWRLRPGKNRLEVVPVNAFGVSGSVSHMSVDYQKGSQG